MARKKEGPPSPAAYAKKIGDKLGGDITPDLFKKLFDNQVDVDDVIQISFDDMESQGSKSENVVTFRPREYVKTGDRISSDIVQGFEKGAAEYRVNKKTPTGPEPIVTRVSFAYKNVDIFAPKDGGDKGFTSLDKEVHDAVVSLYAAGNKVFSPAMVYRTMAGKSDGAFVPQEKLREIIASIHKCMSSIITIDASEEASIYGLEAIYSQNLIYAKSVTLKTKGWEVSAFMLLDEPVLYKYAKLKRQVFSVPLRVLDSPPSKTNDIIVLQGYLVRIVESLRRPGSKQSPVVLYQTLYELLDCQAAPKQKLQRVRDNVKTVLNYWVEIGYIAGFAETSRNRAKYALELEVPLGKLGGGEHLLIPLK